jgi:deoxyribose-phosphate aldolase
MTDTERLKSAIEATRLNFGLTEDDVVRTTRSAADLGVRGVCVPAIYLPAALAAAREEPGWAGELVTVANFPTGDHPLEQVASEARRAAVAGADHLDVVVPGGLVSEKRWAETTDFLREVLRALRGEDGRVVHLKVILETAALDEERTRGAAAAAIEAGARWLKTSTGFHPAGGATVRAVELLRRLAPPAVGVKASGGIRSREAALGMLSAGADRIGTSAEAAILG